VSTLKIDRSFLRDVSRDDDDRAIVTAILAMARSLGLTVTAEGVERTEQAAFLRELGCEQVQGYLYARPARRRSSSGSSGSPSCRSCRSSASGSPSAPLPARVGAARPTVASSVRGSDPLDTGVAVRASSRVRSGAKGPRHDRTITSPHAPYRNRAFLNSKEARALRILAEYLEPKARFERLRVDDTIVFMGSARTPSREHAEEALRRAEAGEGDLERARMELRMSAYYEAARELAHRLTLWSKDLDRRGSGASSCAPAAGPASWRRPTAAPPRRAA